MADVKPRVYGSALPGGAAVEGGQTVLGGELEIAITDPEFMFPHQRLGRSRVPGWVGIAKLRRRRRCGGATHRRSPCGEPRTSPGLQAGGNPADARLDSRERLLVLVGRGGSAVALIGSGHVGTRQCANSLALGMGKSVGKESDLAPGHTRLFEPRGGSGTRGRVGEGRNPP